MILLLSPLIPAIVIFALHCAHIEIVLEPIYLLPLLNTIFLAILPFIIAVMAARLFSATGKLAILLIGAAMMSLGMGGVISGWFLIGQGGPNATITIYNSGALWTALFHFAAGLVSIDFYKRKIESRRCISLAVAYTVPVVLLILTASAAAQQLTPSFIIQGTGPTAIGRTVLNTAIVLMAASYGIALTHYAKSGIPLFLWYSTGLGLFAVGLTGVFLQHAVGSPIGWAGRISQYMGAVFILTGVINFTNSLHRNGESAAEAIENFFEDAEDHYKTIIESAHDGIISLDNEGRILFWNKGAEEMFGYHKAESVGKVLADLILYECIDPGYLSTPLSGKESATSQNNLSQKKYLSFEATTKTREGMLFPVKFSISRRETSNGTVSTCIIRNITERKQTEDALHKAQYLLTEGQKIAHVGSFEYIAATGQTVWTDEEFRIFGMEPTGTSPDYDTMMMKFIHPDDAEQTHRAFMTAMRSGSILELEHRIVRPDGSIRWVYILAHPYYGPKGQLERYIGTTLDITERKIREEEIQKLNADLERKVAERTAALHASEEKYRSLVENTSDCIWEVDENFQFTYLSPTFQQLTGYPAEEFHEVMNFIDITPENLVYRMNDIVSALAVTHKPVESFEYEIRHRKGNRVVVEINAVPIFGSDGSFKGYRGITRDITERKRLEEEVQRREHDLKAILDNIPSLVGYWDKDLRCRFGNHVYLDWFGIDPDKISGMHFKDVIGEEGFRITMPYVEAVLAGHPQIFERVIPSMNGSSVRYDLVHYNPDVRDGQVQGFYVLVSDVTPIKIAEEQRRQLLKAESLGRMAGAIAHHFNNQLLAVIGYLEILLDSEPLGSEKFDMMTEAIMASHKAAEVSKLMLTYLGQSAGNMEIQDVSETCHKGLLMVQALMPKNVSLITEIPLPGPTVKACKKQILQIITNLITNAWESLNDQPGTITVSVNTVSAVDIPVTDRFPIGWEAKEINYVSVKVIDTGCGIPTHSIESLFDPFFTTKFTGRGLGLSVVLGILAAHGGAITVENGTEKGCTFQFFLPLAIEKTSVTVETKQTADAIHTGGMVLLIDDQDQVRNMARMMLSRLGFPDILEAADGVEAVEILQRHQNHIRFVITDLTMPRMNGWQTLDALRKISPDIPVILSSGYDESQAMEGNHPELPQAFLPKPYRKQDLLEAIQKVL